MNLKNKVALVTGASKGIGRQIALDLAKQGVKVGLVARNVAGLKQVKEEITSYGGVANYYAADVTNEREVVEAVENTYKDYGSIGLLVNNAGVFTLKYLTETSRDEFMKVLKTNLLGPFLFTREVVKVSPPEYIVDVLSIAGRTAFEGNSAYAASKFGHKGLSRVVQEELKNTKVFRVYPGAVDTNIWRKVSGEIVDKEAMDMLNPSDVSDLVIDFLNGKNKTSDVAVYNDKGKVVVDYF